MSLGLVRGSTFIFHRWKYRVIKFTHRGVMCVKVNKNDHTLEIPYSQLPAKFR